MHILRTWNVSHIFEVQLYSILLQWLAQERRMYSRLLLIITAPCDLSQPKIDFSIQFPFRIRRVRGEGTPSNLRLDRLSPESESP